MPREENMLILKMLQEGTITAEQAAELLNAMDTSEARAATATPPTPPTPPFPAEPGAKPVPPPPPSPFSSLPGDDDFSPGGNDVPEGDTFARARARIAAARERVAGVQEKLTAAEEKLSTADTSSNPWESVADALKDVPGARAISDALRDPGRLAANARRQARRMGRQMRSSLNNLDIEINLNLAEQMQGEPTISSPREATAPVPPGGTLRVRNTLGDIEAQGADVPEVRVAGVLKIWSADPKAAEALAEQINITVEQSDRGPMIAVQHPPKIRRVQLDLKVFVPREGGSKVSLLSPSGDLTARNLKGGVVLATQSGDARASEIAGDVAMETASGDIAIEGVTGNIASSTASGDIQAIRLTGQHFKALTQSGDISLSEATVDVASLETVSGDASVRNASGRTIRVRAVSGDINAENVAFDDEVHLDSVSGSLRLEPREPLTGGVINVGTISGDASLKLPKKTNAELSLSTKSGDVNARFLGTNNAEKEIKHSGMVSLSETVGVGGGARITVSSVSGDLSVKQDTPVIEL